MSGKNYSFGNFMKKHWLIVLILALVAIIACAVFIPLFCCKINDISDLGSFLGGLLAYLGTAMLGLVTVWQNEKFKNMSEIKDQERSEAEKEKKRLSIKPYIFSEYIEDDYHTYFNEIKNSDFLFIDNFESNHDGYPQKFDVPSEIAKEVDNTSPDINIFSNMSRFLLVKYTIKNIGAGSAVNILMTMNKRKTLFPFALMKKDDKIIYILFDMEKIQLNDEKEVEIQFTYSDIENIQDYLQIDKFYIEKKDEAEYGYIYTRKMDNMTTPEELRSKNNG